MRLAWGENHSLLEIFTYPRPELHPADSSNAVREIPSRLQDLSNHFDCSTLNISIPNNLSVVAHKLKPEAFALSVLTWVL